MDITEVRIKLMEESEDRLRAFCSITFDDCFVTGKRFDMDAGDTARTLYAFTATRVREE